MPTRPSGTGSRDPQDHPTADRGHRGVRRRLRGATVIAAVAAVAATVLAACSDDTSSGAEVTLLTHDSFTLPDSVFDAFRQQTGLTLKVVRSGDAGQLASTVSLTPGSPKADAVFGIDNTFASRPIEAKALESYRSPLAANGSADYAVPDSDDQLTAVDRGDVCLNVDDSWYSDRGLAAPQSLRDLTEPRYRDQAVLLDPATSSPGLGFLLATIGTDQRGWRDYWSKVTANGASIVSGWEIAYNQLFSAGEGKGAKPIVVSYASSPAATPGTSAILDSCFRQVEYVGILRGTRNLDGARKLVDFLLSETVQRELPDSMYVYPVQRDTPLPDGWQARAPVPRWTINLPPTYIAANREQWLQQWREAVGR
ncbi:thiamine ABC transporter substrate-binding protein [Gordonia soli]|uniref:Putative ABC transporter substrate-binding protein n=1 Tax=Gordonia soli NBRC 108243 TaxID=1223545 RepID=M0QDE4_9ACTN|nr:thiamine ABC transporter substrate-binding protein [Gordonia soli]GAC66449.1 putative ABC transporter substrate-binding protein [Gordonia soli NBRC 108243]